MPTILRIDQQDNVGTALDDLAPGAPAHIRGPGGLTAITPAMAIAFGHKVALVPIAAGAPVLKYGEVIGRAIKAIAIGEHVHVHNIQSTRA
jgi:altronate dehydratase small subunit